MRGLQALLLPLALGTIACQDPDPGAGSVLEADPDAELCVGEVDVPDEALRVLLEELLPQPDPPEDAEEPPPPVILARELRQLQGLRAPGLGIKDLTGLECALRLETLGLSGNEIQDLTPIANITGIREIDLASNGLTDLRPLNQLDRLEKVTLDDNGIEDIGPLADLPGLRFVDLSKNAIKDIGPLSALSELTVVVLSQNEIQDVGPLAGLTKIEALRLDRNAVDSLERLEELTELRYLDLDANFIPSLQPLANATGLREIEVSTNALTSLDGLSGKPELLEIRANENMLTTTSGVEGLTALTILELGNNAVTELPGVETLASLRKLGLADNLVTDIRGVTGLPELRDLDLRRNPGLVDVSAAGTLPLLGRFWAGGGGQSIDLSALAGLQVLRRVVYTDGGTTDLSVVGQLPALEVLDFSRTPLSAENIEQISFAGRLQSLTIEDCGVTSLEPLRANSLMESLRAARNGFGNVAFMEGWPRASDVDVSENPITDLAGVEALEILRVFNVSNTQIDNLDPLAANETFRTGDEVTAEDTLLGEDDCGAVAVIRERMARVFGVDCG